MTWSTLEVQLLECKPLKFLEDQSQLQITIMPNEKLLFYLGAAASQSFTQGKRHRFKGILGTKEILLDITILQAFADSPNTISKSNAITISHQQHCSSNRETDARCNPSSAWPRWGAVARTARPRGRGPGHDQRVKSNLLSSCGWEIYPHSHL